MYDPETARLLRSAPVLSGLDPETLPELLTSHYAQIVSMRLGGEENRNDDNEWSLEKIADAYELIASVNADPAIRRPSAFVAGSAQQVIARKNQFLNLRNSDLFNISKERVDPSISAVLLFLAAEQYADANEAASQVEIEKPDQSYEATILSQHIVNLAKGELSKIITRGEQWRDNPKNNDQSDLEALAVSSMLGMLATGIEALATQLLGIVTERDDLNDPTLPRRFFESVLSLATNRIETGNNTRVDICYPGIGHLASLLISAFDGIVESALTKIPPPEGSDADIWQKWISFRAKRFPYLWPNHRKAVENGFHKNGVSAVVVLPTGAGKTTVSSLKIASVLAKGKKVIFLAPTHALVDQLTRDLQEMFPKEVLGSSVSRDFDLLLKIGAVLPEIEVMTPERCLAMLSFSPESFQDVGLLVFDECHLLSPESGKIRRALDGMLCILAFSKIVPNADSLFLSAMIKNGEEFSHWIADLTDRACVSVDLLWKPSRQARGVVIYEKSELDKIQTDALNSQNRLNRMKGKRAVGLRFAAETRLTIQPRAIWGLQHNWLDMENNTAVYTITKLVDEKVQLSGVLKNNWIAIKPNVNSVASTIAAICSMSELKTIVFVNQKSHALSTAKAISEAFPKKVIPTLEESLIWEALTQEVGDLKHSLLNSADIAVPHNANMLGLERELAEKMFRRDDGARVIVATPTLAQGLNLPAQIAILAGDKRADTEEKGRRKILEAHELLNAAARAGRAGHLANGVVLLIPEPILHYSNPEELNNDVVQKLQSLIPEDDRCVDISDPLGVVLDRISAGESIDRDVQYVVNRMTSLNVSGLEDIQDTLFDLSRSFAAFKAAQRHSTHEFNEQLKGLTILVASVAEGDIDQTLAILASQSGLPPNVLSRLKAHIQQGIGTLPETIAGWAVWVLDWLREDEEARDVVLYDVSKSVLGATGHAKKGVLSAEIIEELKPGIISWITGAPLNDIERALGGNPEGKSATNQMCPRARELVSSVVPRGFSFIMGLVTLLVKDVNPFEAQQSLTINLIESISPAIRLGYDSPEKLEFAINNNQILTRVAVHKEFKDRIVWDW